MLSRLLSIMGFEPRPPQWRDKMISAVGAGLSMLALFAVAQQVTPDSAMLVVASMGASSVLLFAVPHGPLSQPWQLIVGHLLAAIIGVSCQRYIDHATLAAALAVGGTVLFMRVTHSIHPPGGATALTAVIGGQDVAQLGYGYVLTPVMLNIAVMLTIAVAFNALFGWRRYPAKLATPKTSEEPAANSEFAHADLVYALSEMDTFMDVSEQDLLRIYDLAAQHRQDKSGWRPPALQTGHSYSNGRYGSDWQVREIVTIEPVGDDDRHIVTYRIVAGAGRRRMAKSGLLEFGRWARYRVARNESSWQRVEPVGDDDR